MTVTIKTTQCRYQKDTGSLHYDQATTFPGRIVVHSDKTKLGIEFIADMEGAILHDFWNGVMMEYRPTVDHPGIKKLVLCKKSS